MRTNIDIDDKLMDYVMATGDFKTKREAVEAGLQLIKRRHAYDALLAARGTLFWDDSDEAWAKRRAEHAAELAAEKNNLAAADAQDTAEFAVNEPAPAYQVDNKAQSVPPASTHQRKPALKASKS
jgi:Arc/MetJ family transcription regulator